MSEPQPPIGPALEERLRKARGQIQQLEKELELTSRGVTALTLDLERSQERFRLLVENIGAAFRLAYVDEPGLEYVSTGFESVWGLSPDAVREDRRKLMEVVHPDDRSVAERQLLRPDFDSPEATFRIRHPSSGERWLRDRIYRVRDDGESAERVAAITLDVTAEEAAEERLRMSEARHRALLQEHPDAVFALDDAGWISEWNQQCRMLTGLRDEDLRGRSFLEFFPEADWDWITGLVEETVSDRSPRSFETRFFPDSSAEREVHVTTLPIVVAGGTAGFFAIVKDVTDEKKMERQFLHAQKMEAVGRMAGGIVHDFNNILTAIGNHVRLIAEDVGEDAPVENDLQEVLRATERAANLTRQLLSFSRQQAVKPSTAILDEVVEEMLEMVDRVAGERIELRAELDASGAAVAVDPGQLQQIVMNLVVNACAAMPEGGRLSISTRLAELGDPLDTGGLELDAGSHVVLRLGDTGTGMDREVQRRAFDPFFTTKGSEGTGLGLSTVYGIVKQRGGDVSLYSEPGIGTIFKLYFPRVEAELGESPRKKAPAAPRLRPSSGSATVLLVEDDASVRSATRRILERNGCRVFPAGTMTGALELMRANARSIDLVLSDVLLPDGTGPQLVKEIFRLAPRVAVVFMSGYSSREVVDWSREELNHRFLEKPFTPEDLLSAIASAASAEEA